MKKILILIFLSSQIFANFDTNSTHNVFSLISQILDVNKKIKIITNIDQNETSSEISTLKEQKLSILSKFPLSIIETKIDKEAIDKYTQNRTKIQNRLKIVSKNKKSNEYLDTKIDDLRFKILENFYKTIFSLQEFYHQGSNDKKIKNTIKNGLINLQTANFKDINDIKNSLKELNSTILDDKFNEVLIEISNCEDILGYLLENSAIFESNIILTSFNLKYILDVINSKIPFDIGFNFAKLFLIAFVFGLFLSLTKIFTKLTYFLMSKIVSQNTHQAEIVGALKSPIRWLLITYGIFICVLIGYYPVPINPLLSKIFSIIYTIAWTWFILKILDGYGLIFLGKLAKKSGRKEVVNLIIKVLYIIIILISFLIILRLIGFDVSTIIASLGIGGLAVALATKDIIANFFASILLLVDNSFSQGDWVVVGDVEGTVVETGLRKTTIRTFDNSLVFVPNSNIMSQNIKNWSRRKLGRQIKMYIGIEYSSTKEQIQKCLDDIKEMLFNHPQIAKPNQDSASKLGDLRMLHRQNMVSVDDLAGYKSNLFVVLDKFDDSSINILIYCFSKTIVWGDFLNVKQDVMMKIIEILEKNGVGFAFPSQSLYVEKLPNLGEKDERL